jgi:hypothetical protein
VSEGVAGVKVGTGVRVNVGLDVGVLLGKTVLALVMLGATLSTIISGDGVRDGVSDEVKSTTGMLVERLGVQADKMTAQIIVMNAKRIFNLW